MSIKNIIKGPIDFTQIPDIPKNPNINIPDIDLSEEISNIYLNYQGLKEYHSKVKNALNTKVNLEDYNSYKKELDERYSIVNNDLGIIDSELQSIGDQQDKQDERLSAIETENEEQDRLINGINNRIAIYNKYTGDIDKNIIFSRSELNDLQNLFIQVPNANIIKFYYGNTNLGSFIVFNVSIKIESTDETITLTSDKTYNVLLNGKRNIDNKIEKISLKFSYTKSKISYSPMQFDGIDIREDKESKIIQNVIISDHTDDANGKCIIINSTGSTLPESKPYTIVFGEKGFIINDDKPGNTYNNIITINNDELKYKNILVVNDNTIKYKNKEIPTDPIDINFDQTCENTNAQENALIMKGK